MTESSHSLRARLLRPKPIEDVLDESDDAREVLRRLVQLQAVGLLTQVSETDPQASISLSRVSLELFLGRVGRDLEARGVEGSPESRCIRVADVLRNFGVWTHYELLGVGRHDDEASIHRGYVELAKVSHPNNAARLGLEGQDAALLTIFEVATQAYLTLSNPDRRKEYDRDLGPEIAEPHSEQRRLEKASVARDMYLRARRMMLEEEFQPVLELMRQAIRLDPQAEYYVLQGQVQLRNPDWKSGAV
ncbi:MAG: DnaJ domain-containing protein, partial [Acidobacteriota bacterium]|nr:DnaJ domain-containing protein [Acidobacteriota bacterium]